MAAPTNANGAAQVKVEPRVAVPANVQTGGKTTATDARGNPGGSQMDKGDIFGGGGSGSGKGGAGGGNNGGGSGGGTDGYNKPGNSTDGANKPSGGNDNTGGGGDPKERLMMKNNMDAVANGAAVTAVSLAQNVQQKQQMTKQQQMSKSTPQ